MLTLLTLLDTPLCTVVRRRLEMITFPLPLSWLHTVNFGSEMVLTKHVSGKNIFCSMNLDKIRGKEFLKSYIDLLSCHLTSTGQPAHSAGMNGAV